MVCLFMLKTWHFFLLVLLLLLFLSLLLPPAVARSAMKRSIARRETGNMIIPNGGGGDALQFSRKYTCAPMRVCVCVHQMGHIENGMIKLFPQKNKSKRQSTREPEGPFRLPLILAHRLYA